MAIQYTPALSLPYPEVTDAPLIASRDLRALAQKMDSAGAQIRGESEAALTAGQAAEALAAQALARANMIEDPIHVGPNAPTDGEALWVDTDEDAPPTPVSVSSEDITDATDVGRAVLTAPLSANARNALAIFTGTRALLDAGTDEAERTWDAKELHEYVTDTVEAAGGAASWDDLTGKPETFPPSAHNHDDRYYTEAEVDAKIAALAFDTGWRNVVPLIPAATYIGGDFWVRRIGRQVWLHFENLDLADVPNSSAVNPGFSLPLGWRPVPTYTYLPFAKRASNYSAGPMRVSKFGAMDFYDHDPRLLYTGDVSWLTNDAIPTTPLGAAL